MVWLNEHTECDSFLVEDIVLVKSGKGFILKNKTIEVEVFEWRSSKVLEQLLTAMASWIEAGQGFVLEVRKNPASKSGHEIRPYQEKGKKKATVWRFSSDGYTCRPEDEEEENPFLS